MKYFSNRSGLNRSYASVRTGAPGTGEASKVDEVSFIFDFLDELRRKVLPGQN